MTTTGPFAIDGRYGIIHNNESDFVDDLTKRIKDEFGEISFLEIGIYGGGAARGMYRRGGELGCSVKCAGVDIDKLVAPMPTGYEFYHGDSLEAWSHIKGTFNFLFIDGAHDCEHAEKDFLNYSPFLVSGGYCLFHDTMGTAQLENNPAVAKWMQGPSDPARHDSPRHGVRKALSQLGLLEGSRSGWEILSEVMSNDYGMGMICFKKISAHV